MNGRSSDCVRGNFSQQRAIQTGKLLVSRELTAPLVELHKAEGLLGLQPNDEGLNEAPFSFLGLQKGEVKAVVDEGCNVLIKVAGADSSVLE